jgi:hypothetical protein
MDLGKNEDRHQDGVTRDAPSLSKREGMAPWRWLLFAVMARLEVGEDVYLRIPPSNVARSDAGTDPSR